MLFRLARDSSPFGPWGPSDAFSAQPEGPRRGASLRRCFRSGRVRSTCVFNGLLAARAGRGCLRIIPPMLRSTPPPRQRAFALALVFLVGALAATLVLLGNPGNMGICGACFLRDLAGALGLFTGEGPRIFRPELLGLLLGPFLWMVLRGRFAARSGSHAATRLFFGMWMGIGALVCLGCPIRMLQRVGGGDLNAVVALAGLIPGVGLGLFFERRGYRVGRTEVVHAGVGVLPIGLFLLFFGLFLGGRLLGPGPGDGGPPPHAPWFAALALATAAGAILSATRYCTISAARQIFTGDRLMLIAALVLVLGYGLTLLPFRGHAPSFSGQPVAHSDHLFNILGMFLVGLCGCLAGGCPVRQAVMAGEGNGDALCTLAGIVLGVALAHSLGLASTPAGATEAGRIATLSGIGLAAGYGYYASTRRAQE